MQLEVDQLEYIAWLHGDRDPIVAQRAERFAVRQDREQDSHE